ncbi:hypothetical protein HC776_03640 [bacterium]|nr:hypothetical protein [bacterium]
MTNARHTLLTALHQHQQAGDVAAQAAALMALAALSAEEGDEDPLAQGLYGQAWALYEQHDDVEGIVRAMCGVSAVMPLNDPSLNRDAWLEDALTLALARGSYQSQAEVYWAMSHHPRGWFTPPNALNTFILAYASYDLAGTIPTAVMTPNAISEHFKNFFMYLAGQQVPFYAEKERLIARYAARGDRRALAVVRLAYGETAFWGKDYGEAQHDLTAACRLFEHIGDDARRLMTLRRLLRLALRVKDYALYTATHAQLAPLVRANDPAEEVGLWLELALIACDYDDAFTMRRAYLAAAVAALPDAKRQANVYWHWGQMEYDAGRRAMGLTLLRWALTLIEHYAPDQALSYTRQIEKMALTDN